MSDAPKHIWPGEEELDGINMREWAGDYRYTLTSGPEYLALIELAREALEGAHAWDCHYDSIGECSCSIHALTRMLAWLEGTP